MSVGNLRWLAVLLSVTLVTACKPEEPQQNGQGKGAIAFSYTLTQSEFNSLSPDNQFVVANKVLSVMQRGVPADEFFDLSQGFETPVVAQSNFLNTLQYDLQTPLSGEELSRQNKLIFGISDDPNTEEDESIPPRFNELDGDQPHQITLARMHSYPISQDQFVLWMSYFLANTIMFSPAREMESVDEQDIARVLEYLQGHLSNGTGIREIIKGWLHNLSRWRVSRSAENHALEMFELYLGIFNDTPEEQQNTINGGKACASWYLTDAGDGYQLAKNSMVIEGLESVQVFNKYVTDCDDLYDVVAGHPNLIPRVTEVIVNYFLDGSSAEEKQRLIQNIVSSGPSRFDQIFMAAMFSKSFLLNSERPKSFEENAMNFLHAMHWTPRCTSCYPFDRRTMSVIWDSSNNGDSAAVHNMGWAAMEYKIGRTPFLPMDALSFAVYHKGYRERVLRNTKAFDGDRFPEEADFTEADEPREPPFPIKDGAFYVAGTENLKPSLENLTVDEFIDLLFLTTMGRRATEEEMSVWLQDGLDRNFIIFDEEQSEYRMRPAGGGGEWEYYTDDYAEVILDYMSRLPETYYYRAVR